MMLQVDISSFSYSEKIILENIHFTLKRGEHLSILGESGGGKSTLLHLIYGLLPLENGEIFFEERKLLGPHHSLIPGEPFIKLVAQEFNLMPFTTVSENIGSHLSRLDEESDNNRILDLLEVVELTSYKDTKVKNLSGGQKQRVALAKALADEPKILLLDEPFSNIDSFLKNRLRRKLFNYLKKKNIACISATHDSVEALAFSDTILMLRNGSLEMIGSPEEIYSNVSDEYQAGFFDDVNLLPKNLVSEEKTSEEMVVFPHQLQISEDKTSLKVKVEKCYFRGNHYLIQSVWNHRRIFFESRFRLQAASFFYLQYYPRQEFLQPPQDYS